MVPALAAAGYSTGEIAAFEAATWGATGYAAYRNRPRNKKSMPYVAMPTKRKSTWQGQLADRPRKRNMFSRNVVRNRAIPRNRFGNHRDEMVVSMRSVATIGITAHTDVQGLSKTSDIPTLEMWTRMSNLYSHFKIIKIKIAFQPTPGLCSAYSYVQADDDVAPGTINDFLKQKSLYIHNLADNSHPHGRTFQLQQHGKFRDFYRTADANALLTLGTSLDASIKYYIESERTAAEQVRVISTFVVVFKGFQSTTPAD